MKKEQIQEKFNTLYEYCVSDVEAEYAISQKLGELPERELAIWLLDQKINECGVHIDTEAVRKAIKVFNKYYEKLTEELIDLTDGEIKTINQTTKIKEWALLLDEELPDLKAETVDKYITTVKNPKVKRMLGIRQALAKASVKKYIKMLDTVDTDNRIRDTLRYYGASTGRWAGKHSQLQNLPRGGITNMDEEIEQFKSKSIDQILDEKKDTGEYLSSLVRGVICSPPNKKLLVADYASIEARVLSWLADDTKTLNQYETGVDLYKHMASSIYNTSIESVTPAQRQLGKQAILGAGYGMGVPKFKITCEGYGIEVSEELAKKAIETYRLTHPEIVKLWRDQNNAAILAVLNPNKKYEASKCSWRMCYGFLKCRLPSGRELHYPEPEIEHTTTPWGEMKNQITYKTVLGDNFKNTRTYGGKLVENIVQAVARDLLVDALLRLDKAGFSIVLHIHDEIIAEVPENDNNRTLTSFCTLMEETPLWAKGCPIKVEGWEGKHFKK